MMRIGIVIPTLNAGADFESLLKSIALQNANINQKIIIDSSSSDLTVDLARTYGYELLSIDKVNFNHGGTRQCAIDYLKNVDIVVLLTQDVLLHNENSICNLTKPFSDNRIGAAYGRQLPHKNAAPLAAQARLFNYPPSSQHKTYEDRTRFGIKTVFISNSFAAYRMSCLKLVGGFPSHVIIAEDMYVAAQILKNGYHVFYNADACVYHSHDYTLWQEFKRYFDTGVFQQCEAWIQTEFGRVEGEGIRLVAEQLRYLIQNQYYSIIPKAMLVNVAKLLGYRLGMHEKYLPKRLKRLLSGQSYFFK